MVQDASPATGSVNCPLCQRAMYLTKARTYRCASPRCLACRDFTAAEAYWWPWSAFDWGGAPACEHTPERI